MEICTLERVEKIKEFLEEKKNVLLEERFRKIKNLLKEETENGNSRWKEEMLSFAAEKEEGYLVFSFLRSSYLTGSHKFLLSFFIEELFLEENPDSILISFYPFFMAARVDMKEMEREMENMFVHLLSAEKEEIYRWYMEQLYQGFGVILSSVLEKREDGIEVYYGEVMEEVYWIGRV